MEKEFLNSTEVCQLLRISKSTLQKWNKEGLDKAKRKIGGKHLYEISDVRAFVNEKNTGGKQNE